MSIVPHNNQPRWIGLLPEAAELARMVANSNFVPAGLRGNEAEIAAAVLFGDEVGLPPMQSLSKISVIQGRPTLAAETQRALILAAGHEIWFEETTATRVTVCGRRRDSDQIQRVTWTADDVRRAGLAGKQSHRQYPRQMLEARASAELARNIFADVIGGLAATEEIEEGGEPVSEQEPAAASPASTRRRRRPTGRAAAIVAPSPPSTSEEPPPPPLPDEQPLMTDAQSRKLFALLKEHGLTERDDRLDWVNAQLDRTVVSSKELTDVEAGILISLLEEAPPPASPSAAAPPTISRDRAEILRMMQREAGVDDAWMRAKLAEIGPKVDRVDMNALMALTRDQAGKLQSEINAALDERSRE